MKKIISIDGGKGGTGKSMVSSAMLDTALQAGKNVFFVEADTSNPDVGKAYAEVPGAAVCLDTREGFLELASLIHKTEADVFIINNPARSGSWSVHGGLVINNLERMGAEMMVLWVANRQKDSVELLTDFFTAFPTLPVWFVMNNYWGSADKFEIWHGSKLKGKIQAARGGEISFPDMADRVSHAMRNARLRWDQIESLEFGELIEAERVRNEFHRALARFFE